MKAADVAGLLELVASERPDLLGPVVNTLEYSRAAAGVGDLVERWGIGPEDRAAELVAVAAKTSGHLDGLERTRRSWRRPDQVIDAPNVPALLSFTHGRRARVQEFRRSRRLEIIARKLDRAAESDRRRRSLDRFLAEPRRPVDPEWLRAFLERPR